LARIIAESGQRTLLVDANWQKSSVADAALTAQLDRPHVKALTATPLCDEDLDVLILRPTAPISELNASLSILATLQDQMPRYDCLVIDFQSAERTGDLAVSMGVIAEICVVLEAGRTTPESLRGFLQLIPRDKVAAIILNKITAGMTRAPLDINLTPPSGAGKDAGRGKGHD
jgi:Mrp family chromosome partitioning ATPase